MRNPKLARTYSCSAKVDKVTQLPALYIFWNGEQQCFFQKSVELAKYPNETEPYCHIGVLRRYGTRRSSHARQKVSLQFLTVRHPYERLVSL